MNDRRSKCRDCAEWRESEYNSDSGKCHLRPNRPQYRKAEDSCRQHTPNLSEYMSSPEESRDSRAGSEHLEYDDLGQEVFG